MKLWRVAPFVILTLAVQAQSYPAAPSQPTTISSTSVPLYQVMVVQGSAKAINYRDLKSSTKIDLKGTALLPHASGVATIKSKGGVIHIIAKVKDMPVASTFGGEFLTYVLWGVSVEGRATNLGEMVLKNGKCKLEVTEQLQTFGLVVTAEPYFAVSQPSDAVVMENAIRRDSKAQFELIDAKFELLKRGQYTLNLASTEPIVMDKKTPFVLYQARNAVRIAQAAGAGSYAPEAFEKAQGYLRQSEAEGTKKKVRVMMAREAVQRSEDARLISMQRHRSENAAFESRVAQDKIAVAKNEALLATTAKDAALVQTKAAKIESQSLHTELKERDQQAKASENENQDLRVELRERLSSILQTRATARGLVMNMSGVLFQNGKTALLPAAREKLAKIAGILSAHKGLKITVEGYTDSVGSEALNMRLSEKRAENTRQFLISQGLLADSIVSRGFGMENPIASNDAEAGRRENRRVEMVISGMGVTDSSDVD